MSTSSTNSYFRLSVGKPTSFPRPRNICKTTVVVLVALGGSICLASGAFHIYSLVKGATSAHLLVQVGFTSGIGFTGAGFCLLLLSVKNHLKRKKIIAQIETLIPITEYKGYKTTKEITKLDTSLLKENRDTLRDILLKATYKELLEHKQLQFVWRKNRWYFLAVELNLSRGTDYEVLSRFGTKFYMLPKRKSEIEENNNYLGPLPASEA